MLTAHVPFNQGAAAIKFLGKNYAMPPDLLHLKRVRKGDADLQVILGRFQVPPPADIVTFLEGLGEAVFVETAVVPKYRPLTREQLASAMEIWPVTYNKPSRTPLTVDEATKMRYSKYLEEARAYETEGGGCVFVYNNEVVARAGCQSSLHPLHHSVMRAIEMVSAHARRGTMKKSQKKKKRRRSSSSSSSRGDNNNVGEEEIGEEEEKD